MTVHLQPTPANLVATIHVGTTLRKPANVLRAYLAGLLAQDLPPNVRFVYRFIDDGLDEEAKSVVDAFCAEHDGALFVGPPRTTDFTDAHPVTHQWTPTAMARVGQLKDQLIDHALASKADALWFVDADLLCDRTTFASLWSCRAPIACAVYWTHWMHPSVQKGMMAAPQVWLQHPYQLFGRGMDEPTFRRRLLSRERLQVWGQGACTVIRRDVMEKGVRFAYLPNVPTEGMMAGEDRHFCIHAESKHVPMYADAWPDIFHVYHPDDHALIGPMSDRLFATHPLIPQVGDLVNLVLEPLEPVQVAPGQFGMVPAQHIRGRLGALPLLPEIEDAVGSMERGTDRIVAVNFPVHFPEVGLRGRRRLIKVALIDCKRMGHPPVVERELLVSPVTWQDRTTLTAAQQVA